MRLFHWRGLPVVDAFRTLVACPPPAIRAVFRQIQSIASV